MLNKFDRPNGGRAFPEAMMEAHRAWAGQVLARLSGEEREALVRTRFAIVHRLSTIRDADLILVMREGKLVEQRTHEEPLARGGFYAERYRSPFVGAQQP